MLILGKDKKEIETKKKSYYKGIWTENGDETMTT
jgi:hypothetical protein